MTQTHSLDLESGSTQYAYILNDIGISGGNVTLEGWFKLESTPSDTVGYAIVQQMDAGTNVWYQIYYYNDGGTMRLFFDRVRAGVADARATITTTLTTGTWYHVALTYDGTNLRSYLNGSLGTTVVASGNGSGTNSNDHLSVGIMQSVDNSSWTPASNRAFDGLIKDVRVFSDARTQAEIIADAHTETVSDVNLVGEWNFNNSYTDSSGNSNTLTATGSPVFSTNVPWNKPSGIDGSTYLETNLVSYYKMDEASGTREDSHGSNDLTDNNTVGSATGIIDNGADFESTNSEYLSITDASQSGLDITSDLSISAWVKFESNTTAYQVISSKYLSTGNQQSWQFRCSLDSATDAIRADMSANGTAVTQTALNYSFTTGTWYHIVFSYSASVGRVEVFVNGSSAGVMTGQVTSIFNGTAPYQVGLGNPGGSEYLDGVLDEHAIYSRSLNYGDVLDLYNSGTAIPYASGTAYNIAVTVGAFILTGIDTIFTKTLAMATAVGEFILTGIDITFGLGKGIGADTGVFVLTGITTSFHVALSIVTAVGEFVLTGIDVTMNKGKRIITEVGVFILTGSPIGLPIRWRNPIKNVVTVNNLPKSNNVE